jgi:hypothetical protein
MTPQEIETLKEVVKTLNDFQEEVRLNFDCIREDLGDALTKNAREIFQEINGEIEQAKTTNLDRTADYREGFIDGLQRTKELIDDLYPQD